MNLYVVIIYSTVDSFIHVSSLFLSMRIRHLWWMSSFGLLFFIMLIQLLVWMLVQRFYLITSCCLYCLTIVFWMASRVDTCYIIAQHDFGLVFIAHSGFLIRWPNHLKQHSFICSLTLLSFSFSLNFFIEYRSDSLTEHIPLKIKLL